MKLVRHILGTMLFVTWAAGCVQTRAVDRTIPPVGSGADSAIAAEDGGGSEAGSAMTATDGGSGRTTNDAGLACVFLPPTDAAFHAFPYVKGLGSDASCCLLTLHQALCRESIKTKATAANHEGGAARGFLLVGVSDDPETPWLRVPLEVDEIESMIIGFVPMVRLEFKVTASTIVLSAKRGCPRPPDLIQCRNYRTPRGEICTSSGESDVLAERACSGVGTYEIGSGRRPP